MHPGGEGVYWQNFPWHGQISAALERINDTFRPKGFASAYGRVNEKEDRAMVVQLLMAETARANKLAKHDSFLASKMHQMKIEFDKRTNGRMGLDNNYWEDLAAGIVEEDYWDN